MSTNQALAELAEAHLYQNYVRPPIVFDRGRGCELFDVEGKRWLDMCAGVATCSVGHSHPTLARAICEQASKLMHVSNFFLNAQGVRAAAELCTRTGFDRAMFLNSGSEANEAALKLARRFFHDAGQRSRTRIIAFHNAFHGRSLGALAMTGNPKYREGFGEIPGVTHIAYGDRDALKRELRDDVAAVNIEPIQGEGGVIPAPNGFLRFVRDACDEVGALMLADEVQTGMGRTGHFLAVNAEGVAPDVVALAKGMGGGFPVGAIVTREKYARVLPPGAHGATFGGNALAATAVLTTLKIIEEEKLVERAAILGEKLGAKLRALALEYPQICEQVRGRGLMWGIVMRDPSLAKRTIVSVRDAGVLLLLAGERVVRFTPSLVVTEAELDEGVTAVRNAIKAIASDAPA